MADDGRGLAALGEARDVGPGGVLGQGHEQAAGGLRVEQHVGEVERDVCSHLDARPEEIAVAVGAGRDEAHLRHLAGARHDGHVVGMKLERDAAGLGHLAAMAHEREARDVGGGVSLKAAERLGAVLVEGDHGVGGDLHAGLVEQLGLVGRGEHAGAEGLGEHEGVPHPRAGVGEHAVELDEAGDGQAELGLVIVDGVAARHDDAGLAALVGATGEDLASHLEAQAVGEAQQVEGERGAPSHGPDVGEGVGGGHLAEEERVVHHGREEVGGAHQAPAVAQVIDVGVVGGVEAHEQVGVVQARKVRKDLREVAGRKLRGAPRRLHELGELNSGHVHMVPPQ